jgi:hypothetical protein
MMAIQDGPTDLNMVPYKAEFHDPYVLAKIAAAIQRALYKNADMKRKETPTAVLDILKTSFRFIRAQDTLSIPGDDKKR